MPPRLPRVWQSIPTTPLCPIDFGLQLDYLLPRPTSVKRAVDEPPPASKAISERTSTTKYDQNVARRWRRAKCILGESQRQRARHDISSLKVVQNAGRGIAASAENPGATGYIDEQDAGYRTTAQLLRDMAPRTTSSHPPVHHQQYLPNDHSLDSYPTYSVFPSSSSRASPGRGVPRNSVRGYHTDNTAKRNTKATTPFGLTPSTIHQPLPIAPGSHNALATIRRDHIVKRWRSAQKRNGTKNGYTVSSVILTGDDEDKSHDRKQVDVSGIGQGNMPSANVGRPPSHSEKLAGHAIHSITYTHDPPPTTETPPIVDQAIHPTYTSLLHPNPPDPLSMATEYRSNPSIHNPQLKTALHAYATRTNQSKALIEIRQANRRPSLIQQYQQKHFAHPPGPQIIQFDIPEVRKVYKQTLKSLKPGSELSDRTLEHFRGAGLYIPFRPPAPPPGRLTFGPDWPNTPHRLLWKIYRPLWQVEAKHTVEDLLRNLHWCLLAGTGVQLGQILKVFEQACEMDGRSALGRSRALRSVLELHLAYDSKRDLTPGTASVGVPGVLAQFESLHPGIGLNTTTLHYAINSLFRPRNSHIVLSPHEVEASLLPLLQHFRSKHKINSTPDLYRIIGDYALASSLPVLAKFAWTGWASTYEERKRTRAGKYGLVKPDLRRMDLHRVRFEKKGDGLIKWWRLVRGLREKGWVRREKVHDEEDEKEETELRVVQGSWKYIWVGESFST